MEAFQRLDEHLMVPLEADAWYDYGVTVAHNLIGGFSAEDWAELSACWSSRPLDWQHRLADTLGFGAPWHAIPLLAMMLEADDPELLIRAADELRDFAPDD